LPRIFASCRLQRTGPRARSSARFLQRPSANGFDRTANSDLAEGRQETRATLPPSLQGPSRGSRLCAETRATGFRVATLPPGQSAPQSPLGNRPLPSPSIDQRGETRLRVRHCPSPVSRGVTPFRPRKLCRFSAADGQGRAVFQIIPKKRLPRIDRDERQRDWTGNPSCRITDPQIAS